jgi:hypothetical protein
MKTSKQTRVNTRHGVSSGPGIRAHDQSGYKTHQQSTHIKSDLHNQRPCNLNTALWAGYTEGLPTLPKVDLALNP